MTAQTHRRWLIADRPVGRELRDTDFRLEQVAVERPDHGEVLVRSLYLSFDPAQKSWMENVASYRDAVDVGGAGLP